MQDPGSENLLSSCWNLQQPANTAAARTQEGDLLEENAEGSWAKTSGSTGSGVRPARRHS
jgi:hypothetical protein